METNLLSLTAYAERVGKAPTTVREMCQRGSIPGALKIGRSWVIPADAPYTDHRIRTGKYIDARKPEKPNEDK